MASTDHLLLERWTAHRDAEAFKAICDRYASMVYATCQRVSRNRTEAEDLTQDCFEALATTASPPKGHLGPWLHRVATHRALNRSRGERRRRERERAYVKAQAGAAPLAWDDIHDLIDEAIEKLPEKPRVAIVGHFIEGKTHAAIADELGISRAAVTQRIRRGIAGVRKQLKRQGIPIVVANLSVLFEAHLAEAAAVPASVQSAIGRVALSGISAKRTISTIGGITMKTKAVYAGAVMFVALSAGIFFVLVNGSDETPSNVTAKEPRNASGEATPIVVAEEETPHTVEAAQNVPLEAVPQEEQALITGIVEDDYGEPIAGAYISAKVDTGGHTRADSEAVVAETDINGRFRITALPEKSWMLAAWHAGYAPGWTRIPDESAGEKNVVIRLTEGGRITGTVYAGGKPLGEQAVKADYMVTGPIFGSPAKTDEQGHYEIAHLPPGTHQVWLNPNWGGRMISKLAVVEVSKLTVVDFELRPLGAPLTGRAFLGDVPLPDAGVYITVIGEDAGLERFSTSTDAEGYYAFDWLPFGFAILKVVIRKEETAKRHYLRAFELSSGGNREMDITISTSLGSLACHVQMPVGHEVSLAYVLSGQHEFSSFSREIWEMIGPYAVGRGDAKGDFLVDGLEPGMYTVVVGTVESDAGWENDDIWPNSLFATEIVEVIAEEITEISLGPQQFSPHSSRLQ